MGTYYPLKAPRVILHYVDIFYKSSGIVYYSIYCHPLCHLSFNISRFAFMCQVSVIPILTLTPPTEYEGLWIVGCWECSLPIKCACALGKWWVGCGNQPNKQTLSPQRWPPLYRTHQSSIVWDVESAGGEKLHIPFGFNKWAWVKGAGRQSARKLYIYFTNAKALEPSPYSPCRFNLFIQSEVHHIKSVSRGERL